MKNAIYSLIIRPLVLTKKVRINLCRKIYENNYWNGLFVFYYNNQQFNEFGTIHLEEISRKIICPQQELNPRPSNVRLDALPLICGLNIKILSLKRFKVLQTNKNGLFVFKIQQ